MKYSTMLLLLSYLVCRNVGWNCFVGNGSSPFPEVHKTSTYIMYGACNATDRLLNTVSLNDDSNTTTTTTTNNNNRQFLGYISQVSIHLQICEIQLIQIN